MRCLWLIPLLVLIAPGLPLAAGQTAYATALRKQGAFVHPGVLHTQADFDRMAEKVRERQEPWFSTWEKLQQSPHNLGWRARPVETIIRGVPGSNYTPTQKDAVTVYQCALRYKVTGEAAQADKAVEILNAWAARLKGVGGNSNYALGGGIIGYEFAAGAEMVRDYPGWKREDFAAFQAMMRKVFYGANRDFLVRHNNTCGTHYRLNWDTCNMASMAAVGVLCDDRAIFNEALEYFRDGIGNGCIERAIWYVFPDGTAQTEEMGRDQPHNLVGLYFLAVFLEIAWNQGIDLYGYDNNRFLRGVESVAKYNLGHDDLPSVPYRNCDLKYTEGGLSPSGRGRLAPMYSQVYHHYVNRKGMAAPYTKESMERLGIEGGPSGHPSAYDFFGFQTLTYTLDPIARGVAPSGVVGHWGEQGVTLSWFGSAYADGYAIRRATDAKGPYSEIGKADARNLTFLDKDVVEGTAYYYVISATGTREPVPDSRPCRVGQSLIAHYRFAGNAADEVAKRNGVITGQATFGEGPGRGRAIEFDGTSTFITLPNQVAHSQDLTLAVWVNWSGGGDWQRVFDIGGDISKTMFFTPKAGNGGGCRFEITTTRGTDATGRLEGPALPQNQWVHVAVTLKGDVGTLYLDGKPVSTETITIDPLFTQNRCYLGKSQYQRDPLLQGRLADFRIYNHALPAASIEQLVQDRK